MLLLFHFVSLSVFYLFINSFIHQFNISHMCYSVVYVHNVKVLGFFFKFRKMLLCYRQLWKAQDVWQYYYHTHSWGQEGWQSQRDCCEVPFNIFWERRGDIYSVVVRWPFLNLENGSKPVLLAFLPRCFDLGIWIWKGWKDASFSLVCGVEGTDFQLSILENVTGAFLRRWDGNSSLFDLILLICDPPNVMFQCPVPLAVTVATAFAAL